MTRTLIALALAGALAGLGAGSADACTSMIFKAEDGTRIYARTMEWGASDLKSEMMLVPRAMAFSSSLGRARRSRPERSGATLRRGRDLQEHPR